MKVSVPSTFASKLQLASATLDGEPVTQMIIQQNENNSENNKTVLAKRGTKEKILP